MTTAPRIRLAYIGVFVVYVTVRVSHFVSVPTVLQTPDAKRYLQAISPLSGEFWSAPRPLPVSLLYHLVGGRPEAIALLQMALSVASWGVLALAVASALRGPRLGALAFTAILLFSLSDEILLWDRVILTESTALSFMALLIACSLGLLRAWRGPRLMVFLAVAAAWALARDSNAWLALGVGGGLTLIGALRPAWRRCLPVGAWFLLLFVVNDFRANPVQEVGFLHVLGQRVLPDQERTAYFVGRGMPMSPALARRSGKQAWSDEWAFYRDPELGEFRAWLAAHGRSSYIRYLLAHPGRTIREPFERAKGVISPNPARWKTAGYRSVVAGLPADVLFLRRRADWVLWAGVAAVAAGAVMAMWTRWTVWWLALALVALFYPHAALVWHGDPNGLARHIVPAVVHFRLGLWMLALLAVDAAVSHPGVRARLAILGARARALMAVRPRARGGDRPGGALREAPAPVKTAGPGRGGPSP